MNKWLLVALLSLTTLPAYSVSLDELDDEEQEEETISKAISVEWSGLVDMRFAYTGSAVNWADPNDNFGGKGRSRYGSSRGGKGGGFAFHLGQISLVSDVNIMDEVSAHIQLNVSDHRDDKDEGFGNFGIAEAYLEDEFDSALSLRLGFLIPSVSLEHPNIAWSTKYTITPSAINTWLGEEVRTMGLEAKYKIGKNIELTGALFSHNDGVGTMLTYRGWALHDYQGTYGNRLRWNEVAGPLSNNGGWVAPFVESDDRLGWYSKASFFKEDKTFKAELFYYDNKADPGSFNKTNYGWDTKFWNLSVDYQVGNGLRFLMQAMTGTTEMGPDKIVVKARYHSAYLLSTYSTGQHRYSLRGDIFKTEDEDAQEVGAANISDESDKGWSGNFSYFYSWSENKLLGIELLHINSKRKGNDSYGDKDPNDDQFQLMYRLTF